MLIREQQTTISMKDGNVVARAIFSSAPPNTCFGPNDSECPVGYYCDGNDLLGYLDSPMGGDPYANPYYACKPIPVSRTPTATPSPTPMASPSPSPPGPSVTPTTTPSRPVVGASPFPTPSVTPSRVGRYTTTLRAIADDGTPGGTARGTSDITTTPSSIVIAEVGRQVLFSAEPFTGYRFIGWYNDAGLFSSNTNAGIVRSSDQQFEARFTRITTAASPTQTQTVTPSPTPSRQSQGGGQGGGVSPTPTPSATPTPRVDQQQPSPSPTPSRQAQPPAPSASPAPSPSPRPVDTASVEFVPSLREALLFTYTRGSSTYPTAKTIVARNASTTKTFSVSLRSNPDILITPSSFILSPQETKNFTVNVTPQLLAVLGDGNSTLQMDVEVKEM